MCPVAEDAGIKPNSRYDGAYSPSDLGLPVPGQSAKSRFIEQTYNRWVEPKQDLPAGDPLPIPTALVDGGCPTLQVQASGVEEKNMQQLAGHQVLTEGKPFDGAYINGHINAASYELP